MTFASAGIKDENWLTLFKYRSLEGNFGMSNVEDIILNNGTRWQCPLEFNDPFDCSPYFVFGKNAVERSVHFHNVVARKMIGVSRAQRRAKLTKLKGRLPSEIASGQAEVFRKLISESAVTCFSECPTEPLMWAHYADQHRGVCFQFEEQGGNRPFFALAVQYTEKRPVVNTTKLKDVESLRQIVLTKSHHWSYEKEHRLIDYRGGTGFREFPSEVLRAVIFGIRTPIEYEQQIRAMVARRSSPIILKRARIVPTSYEIEIEAA